MILVTGGAGYIGCHVCLELLNAGYSVVVLDNLINSSIEGLQRVEKIARGSLNFVRGDICDRATLGKVFQCYPIDCVIHLAGLKSVAESMLHPLAYYQTNLVGSVNLFTEMQASGVRRIVFSSSATVYGEPQFLPLTEEHPLIPVNPYGRTKLLVEDILRAQIEADPRWGVAILRYFNPVGAHESGMIGDDPSGIPANLLPFVAQAAVGRHERVTVWGDDYPTPDGTGVRDYLHVVDLAVAHVRAVAHTTGSGLLEVNLGAGRGHSVLEVIKTFEEISGRKIPFIVGSRRPGDVAISYSHPRKAQVLLGWKAERDLHAMCRDHWRWQRKNPMGYH
ncbi:UDP-glucose 4-epimerase GalE [Bradyrhizobium sp. ORS 111]|uniref:UDP-glucose 4-epimerase GalE n=1 Tax=Bradyrhizobium sp. ORS 111 TaxID=1685958 RepID=UPI003890B183